MALRHGESFPGYDLFLPHQQLGTSPSQFEEPLTAILLRTTLSARSIDFAHPRVCGVVVSTQRGPLALFSAYFQPTSGAGLMELSSILTRVRQQFPLILLGADCNGHSPWWGPPDTASSPLGRRVEALILHHRLTVVNDPDQGPTFEQGWVGGGETYIDVTLATTSLFRLVHSWQVQSCLPLDSDHHALTYTI